MKAIAKVLYLALIMYFSPLIILGGLSIFYEITRMLGI